MNTALQPAPRLAMPLALPRLSGDIPHAVTPGVLAAANAVVSRFLIDAQVFGEADIPDTWDDSLEACQQALTARIRREIGPLQCLNPGFGMQILDDQGFSIGGYRMNRSADTPPIYREVEIYWCETGEQEWPIGQGLQALEAALSGLGRTILQVLRKRCTHVFPLFTPDIACDVARMIYWNGEDDEETALDMYDCENEQEREALRSEMLTRAMIEAAYPNWAREWMGRTAKKDSGRCSLRRAVQTLTDPRLRRIVADAQALSRLQSDDAFSPERDCEYIGYGAVLSWEEGDVTTRIYDDLVRFAYQGEFCDRMGETRIALDNPGALGVWLDAMQPRFKAIGLIDRLIYQLTA